MSGPGLLAPGKPRRSLSRERCPTEDTWVSTPGPQSWGTDFTASGHLLLGVAEAQVSARELPSLVGLLSFEGFSNFLFAFLETQSRILCCWAGGFTPQLQP